MKKIAIASGLALALFGGQALAQQQRNEVSFFAQFEQSETSRSDSSNTFAGATYGYYFTPRLVGTVGFFIFGFESGNTTSTTTDWELGAKYYFGGFQRGAFVPFVDGAFGTTFISNGIADSFMRWRVGVGASIFISESTSIDPSLSYFAIQTDDETTGIRLGVRLTTRF